MAFAFHWFRCKFDNCNSGASPAIFENTTVKADPEVTARITVPKPQAKLLQDAVRGQMRHRCRNSSRIV